MTLSDDICRCSPLNCEVKQDCLRRTSPTGRTVWIADFSGSITPGEPCNYMIKEVKNG